MNSQSTSPICTSGILLPDSFEPRNCRAPTYVRVTLIDGATRLHHQQTTPETAPPHCSCDNSDPHPTKQRTGSAATMSNADTKPEEAAPAVTIQADIPSNESGTEAHAVPRDSKGWDGKLRMPKTAMLANPEALSDPEYSDDSNVLEGEEISPDEGTL